MIKITKQDDKTIIELSNGHSKALHDIMTRWNITSEKDALGFALSVLLSGDEAEIYVKQNEDLISVIPSKDIRNK